jgi:hypothetical protein
MSGEPEDEGGDPSNPVPQPDPSGPKSASPFAPSSPQEPEFPVTDPSDRLSPANPFLNDASVGAVIFEAQRLIRTARPAYYSEYPRLINAVGIYTGSYRSYTIACKEAHSAAQAYVEDLSQLPMSIDVAKEKNNARMAVGSALQDWNNAWDTYSVLCEIHRTLNPI